MRLPDVIGVGPQRTGTTWLNSVLAPVIGVPKSIKETMFFDRYYANGLPWYAAHFEHCDPARPAAEIAPSYFHNPMARARIAKDIPHCRIVCTLRDPVERLESLYRMCAQYGLVADSFAATFDDYPEFKASSRYATHVRAWQDAFGAENVLVVFFDDLRRDPAMYITRICGWLGVTDIDVPAMLARSDSLRDPSTDEAARNPRIGRLGLALGDWFRRRRLYPVVNTMKQLGLRRLFFSNGSPIPRLTEADARRIRAFCEEDIAALEAMTGRNLDVWRERRS